MQIIKLNQASAEWRNMRIGKITGSKLKDIVVKRGTDEKIGFYELIADRLSTGNTTEDNEESPLERGHRLEPEAIEVFEEETKLEVERDVGLCVHDIHKNIAVSPDGLIIKDHKFKEAVEVKCLSSARHLEAFITKEIPDEYLPQVYQYFIVNEDLEKLYFVFYDPRIMVKPIHWLEVHREDIVDQIKFYMDYQIQTLAKVDEWVNKLSF